MLVFDVMIICYLQHRVCPSQQVWGCPEVTSPTRGTRHPGLPPSRGTTMRPLQPAKVSMINLSTSESLADISELLISRLEQKIHKFKITSVYSVTCYF